MTIFQIGELLQNFVKNGVVRGRDTLSREDYMDLVIIARDHILFGLTKGGQLVNSDIQISAQERDLPIDNGAVALPSKFNIQGITGMKFLTKADEEIDDMIIPVDAGESNSIVDRLFTYALLTQNSIKFRNKPQNAKKIRLWSMAGSSPDDEVSGDVAFLIFKEVMKLGQMSEEKRKDTSADGNRFDDYLANQIRQFQNAPNNIT